MLKASDLAYNGMVKEKFGDCEGAKVCYAKAAQIFWKIRSFDLCEDCFLKATALLLASNDTQEAYDGMRIYTLMSLANNEYAQGLRMANRMVTLRTAYPDYFAGALSFHKFISGQVRRTPYKMLVIIL